jgi:hypothetical protein
MGPHRGPSFFHEQSNIQHVHEKTHTRLKDEIVPTFLTMQTAFIRRLTSFIALRQNVQTNV